MASLTGSKVSVSTGVLADAELGRDKPLYGRLREALADAASSSAIAAEAREHYERSVARFAEQKGR
jgi:hypothetical protein